MAGYLFIALFCLMTWFMILKIKDRPDDLPLPSMVHALIAVLMAPLLFIKVLVARYYKNHTTLLVPLGLTIFVLAFVLVATTAGPYFLRTANVKSISLQAIDMGVAKIDLQASETLMQKRCSRCHNLDRVVGAKKDARGWLATVDRMRGLPASGISESDAKIILSYLLSEDSIILTAPVRKVSWLWARPLWIPTAAGATRWIAPTRPRRPLLNGTAR